MKSILFIMSLFRWKCATLFEWDGWRLKVCVRMKTTIFAITTTQYNANGVVNQSLLSVIVGCLVQIKALIAFFRKNWFAVQKTSSSKQTSLTKVKCFSLASRIYLSIQEELQAVPSHGVHSWYEITFPSTPLFAVPTLHGLSHSKAQCTLKFKFKHSLKCFITLRL